MFTKYIEEDGITKRMLTTEDTGQPFKVWTKSFQEGILVSMTQGYRDALEGFKDGGLSGAVRGIKDTFWNNENDEVKRVHQTNIQQFAYDMTVWGLMGVLACSILGGLLKDRDKEQKNEITGPGTWMLNSLEDVMVQSLKTSTDDLSAFGSMVSPLTNWTPVAFSKLNNL